MKSTPQLIAGTSTFPGAADARVTRLAVLVGAAPWRSSVQRHTLAAAARASVGLSGREATLDDALAALDEGEPTLADPSTWDALVGYVESQALVGQLADGVSGSTDVGVARALHFLLARRTTGSAGRWRGDPGAVARVVERAWSTEEPAWTRAATAHLLLLAARPVDTASGRLARIFETLVLATASVLPPALAGIEEELGRDPALYRTELAASLADPGSPDIERWLSYVEGVHQRQLGTHLARATVAAARWELLLPELARRGLPERALPALYDALLRVRVRNPGYRAAAQVSDANASRDLKALVDAGLLRAEGERRGRSYVATETLLTLDAEARAGLPPSVAAAAAADEEARAATLTLGL